MLPTESSTPGPSPGLSPALLSSPTDTLPSGYRSPARHHQRTPSFGRAPVKETLDACTSYDDEEDGGQGMRINQYNIKQEIGRGSFGAVHLAVDQDGKKFAVKEFSKTRLRKRTQSNILRRPQLSARRGGFLPAIGSQRARSASEIYKEQAAGNPLHLIMEEIAILKKLDHENVACLIEVLDDPEGDSLYMVLEMCEKGVVMKVGLDQIAVPYSEEQCRLWFRDMILGIEYLHTQGIVHRDIKPDNLLLTSTDVLKIVDFGVSELFQKNTPMMTAKYAGSPAFHPPELCSTDRVDINGPAADIWAMGVTLYCLVFGRLPFNYHGIFELCTAIKTEHPHIPASTSPHLTHLLARILDKNPATRITMPALREHPWVTASGTDPLLSSAENTTSPLPPPTEDEVDGAITDSIRNVMTVVRAVRKLKQRAFGRAKANRQASTGSGLTTTTTAGREPEDALGIYGSGRGRAPMIQINTAAEEGEGAEEVRSPGVSSPLKRMHITLEDEKVLLSRAEECESPVVVTPGGGPPVMTA